MIFLRTFQLIKMLFSHRLFFVLFGLLLLIGCTSGSPQTQQQSVMLSLDVQLKPKEAGTIVLNPSPIGKSICNGCFQLSLKRVTPVATTVKRIPANAIKAGSKSKLDIVPVV